MRFRRKGKFIVGAILGIFIFGIVSEVLAGPPLGHGRRHHLRHQRGHHVQGFAGQGFCPQMRTTAQAPEEIRDQKNPLEPSQETLYEGETLFQVDVQPVACKICHGVNGNGLGAMAQGLNPPPRNFTCSEVMRDLPDGQLFWIIQNGSRGTAMPAHKFTLKPEQIWQLILYIKQFLRT